MGAADTKVLFQNFQIFSNPNYTLCLGWTTTKDMPLHSSSNISNIVSLFVDHQSIWQSHWRFYDPRKITLRIYHGQ